MASLSDEDIRAAAAEAGITEAELRAQLQEQSTALATRGPTGLATKPPKRGTSAHYAENSYPLPPNEAVRAVKAAIEEQTGASGQMHGAHGADIYDETTDMTYRVTAKEDGRGGAMVRVDVDPVQATARKLVRGALGGTIGAVGVLMLLVLGFNLALVVGFGALAGLGLFGMAGAAAIERRGIAVGKGVVASALVEAEENVARALPPAT